jgi:hypothetical protein
MLLRIPPLWDNNFVGYDYMAQIVRVITDSGSNKNAPILWVIAEQNVTKAFILLNEQDVT